MSEKALRPNFRVFSPPHALSRLSCLFLLKILAGYLRCLIRCPRRGSVAGGQGLLGPLPRAGPGLQVAGRSEGEQIVRRVLLLAKPQISATPVQQLAKNNYLVT